MIYYTVVEQQNIFYILDRNAKQIGRGWNERKTAIGVCSALNHNKNRNK
tara:strand:+ start:765 stop:911 length:147 start_codon:yes stop_codon:yes gene_type:complete